MPTFDRPSRRRRRTAWVVVLTGLVGWVVSMGWRLQPDPNCAKVGPASTLQASPCRRKRDRQEPDAGPVDGVFHPKGLTGLGMGTALGLVLLKLNSQLQRKGDRPTAPAKPSLLSQYLRERQLPPNALCSSEARLTPLQREILQGLLVLGAVPAPQRSSVGLSRRPPRQQWRYGEVQALLTSLGFSERAIGGVWQMIGEQSPPADLSEDLSEDISLRA